MIPRVVLVVWLGCAWAGWAQSMFVVRTNVYVGGWGGGVFPGVRIQVSSPSMPQGGTWSLWWSTNLPRWTCAFTNAVPPGTSAGHILSDGVVRADGVVRFFWSATFIPTPPPPPGWAPASVAGITWHLQSPFVGAVWFLPQGDYQLAFAAQGSACTLSGPPGLVNGSYTYTRTSTNTATLILQTPVIADQVAASCAWLSPTNGTMHAVDLEGGATDLTFTTP